MFRRPIVHRPHNHGPRVVEALLVAILLGITIKLSTPMTMFYWGVKYFMIWWFWIAASIGLLLFLGSFQRHCRHHKWRFIIGALAVTTMLVTTTVFDPFGTVRNVHFAGEIVVLAVVGGIGGILNIGLVAFKDLLVGRPKMQDGTLCPTCAYIIVGLPESRCPECGNEFTPHGLEASPSNCRRQWWRVALSSTAGLALLNGLYFTCPYIVVRMSTSGWLNYAWSSEYLRIVSLQPRAIDRPD